MEPRTTLTTSTASGHVESTRVQHKHTQIAFKYTSPMASTRSPPIRGENCELSEEGWTLIGLRYGLILPPGKERLPKSTAPKVADAFGVTGRYP